jgi:VanZ family protein
MESVPFLGIPYFDKLVHAFLFGVLAWLICRALPKDRKNGQMILLAFLVVSLYGAGMEFYQDNFTSREFELLDIVADAFGAALAAVWVWIKK